MNPNSIRSPYFSECANMRADDASPNVNCVHLARDENKTSVTHTLTQVSFVKLFFTAAIIIIIHDKMRFFHYFCCRFFFSFQVYAFIKI